MLEIAVRLIVIDPLNHRHFLQYYLSLYARIASDNCHASFHLYDRSRAARKDKIFKNGKSLSYHKCDSNLKPSDSRSDAVQTELVGYHWNHSFLAHLSRRLK